MSEVVTDRFGVSRASTKADHFAAKAGQIPKVDTATGRPRPIEDQPQAVQAAATVAGKAYQPPAPPPRDLGGSIVEVAQELRVDPLKLLADDAFVNAILDVDPDDLDGIASAIRSCGVRPTMQPNPAQGRSSVPAPSAPPSLGSRVAGLAPGATTQVV
jgi:hypothetical protein